jgi:hypothetical protein
MSTTRRPEQQSGEISDLFSLEGNDKEVFDFQNIPKELVKPLELLHKLFYDMTLEMTETFRQKIYNMRLKEARNLSGAKLKKYHEFLNAQNELLQATFNFKSLDDLAAQKATIPHHKDFEGLANKAVEQFHETVTDAADKITTLAASLIQSPMSSVQLANLKLLTDTAKSLEAISKNPADEQSMTNLINNTKLIYQKMGTFWSSLKNKLTAVIGAACIVVGVLGLVPSFGVSVALIGLGGLLCVRAGLSTLKMYSSFANPTKKTADELAKDTQQLFKDVKHLLSFKREIKEEQKVSTRKSTLQP